MTTPKEPKPFVFEQRVSWGQCDPAQIAYTGWIPMWALESINGWWSAHAGAGWYELQLDRNVGTPFVRLEMDFRSPITPRHMLMCHVRPKTLGNSSITFEVRGFQDDVLCFEGLFTSVFVIADAFKTRPAPPELREIIEPFLDSP